MPYLALGLLVLGLVYVGMNVFVRSNPAVLARVLARAGGLVGLGAALVLLFTGRFAFAIPVAVVAFGLLTGRGFSNPFAGGGSGFGGIRGAPSGGGASEVRSAFLRMALDHDTGEMHGTVEAGTHAGQALDDLTLDALKRVLVEARGDADSVRLLEAYLDRRMPGWREDVETDGHAGQGSAGGEGAGLGPLSLQEAYEILGLQPGATPEEIRQAHKAMMKRVHPDFGGSAHLAARVNAAKDLALANV